LNNRMLNERAQHLLKTLVERYIEDGQPVGSRTLAKNSGLKVSPATVRNVMSDLEELGLIHAPHTSAGRIPTVSGYRVFVDSLLTYHQPGAGEIRDITHYLDSDMGMSGLLEATSGLLSEITQLAGIVTLPKKAAASLRQVEFLPLSQSRVLVILVTNEQEVENFIIRTSRDYSDSELRQLANLLTETYCGFDLHKIRENLLADMQNAHSEINQMMSQSVEVAEKALLPTQSEDDFVLVGEANLLSCLDLGDIAQLRTLFGAFTEKQELLSLLDQCIGADGVRIFIGNESGYSGLDDCSVVSSPYQVGTQQVGVLGVIGPTRMAYEKVIPLVDVTAKLLSAALNAQKNDS